MTNQAYGDSIVNMSEDNRPEDIAGIDPDDIPEDLLSLFLDLDELGWDSAEIPKFEEIVGESNG